MDTGKDIYECARAIDRYFRKRCRFCRVKAEVAGDRIDVDGDVLSIDHRNHAYTHARSEWKDILESVSTHFCLLMILLGITSVVLTVLFFLAQYIPPLKDPVLEFQRKVGEWGLFGLLQCYTLYVAVREFVLKAGERKR